MKCQAYRPRQASSRCHQNVKELSTLCNWIFLCLPGSSRSPCSIADINILEGFVPNPNDGPQEDGWYVHAWVLIHRQCWMETLLNKCRGLVRSQPCQALLCLLLKNSSTGVQTETPGPVGTYSTLGARVGFDTWFCRCENDARAVGFGLSLTLPSNSLTRQT